MIFWFSSPKELRHLIILEGDLIWKWGHCICKSFILCLETVLVPAKQWLLPAKARWAMVALVSERTLLNQNLKIKGKLETVSFSRH